MDTQYNYDLFQQIYCLSFMAGFVGWKGSEETLQNALKQTLEETLPHLTGNWAVSWGPRVYKVYYPDSESTPPDNTWFAAVDDIQKICVVAIAGTNIISLQDLYQDFDVLEVVDFDAWVSQWTAEDIPEPEDAFPIFDQPSTRAYCAKGTCSGVRNILNNTETRYGDSIRIGQYLRSLDPTYTIVVTGHSLGGALAPIAALGLVKAKLLGNHQSVKVVPSAGVSPGNELLAASYSERFPVETLGGKGYQVFNADYYNIYDIVPQAWSPDRNDDRNLHRILDEILHLSDDLRPLFDCIMRKVIGVSQLSQIKYSPLPGEPFDGPEPPSLIETPLEIIRVIIQEHLDAYRDEIGITEFLDRFQKSFLVRIGAQGPSVT
ncbi:hypothetical protein O1611_g4430 [Lasiodiplodia mahajangana]|uniref:Uncharacterized protein n=1 Tax=Lasiodiplodia mahajangana TaxID=1108764 RepID=A0ACC2JNY3_9PEZI|nr:hypothetical protein O1611_g4430 [Lasiodiplodia mahajangana]